MIDVSNLEKGFGDQRVLRGVNLHVDEGDIVSLVGASGSGKSVLLRNIVGLMTPDSGTVTINGMDVHSSSEQTLSSVRDYIGMLFQNGALFDSMTVYENLAFPLREKTAMSRDEIEEAVTEQLKRVNLSGTEEKYPAELSGGMQKRVALARTLIRDPDIVFFDEPTTGLDPIIANSMLRLIYNLHQKLSFTAVVVSHNFDKVFEIVSQVAMLHNGVIHAYQPPEEFMNSSDDTVKHFVDEAIKGPLEAINE
jgi:phospholipid/cholesterol/gamma-HCH transport system ATP-binding protein